MALVWVKHGPNMALKMQHHMVLFCLKYMTYQQKFEPFQKPRSKDIVKIANPWPLHEPNKT